MVCRSSPSRCCECRACLIPNPAGVLHQVSGDTLEAANNVLAWYSSQGRTARPTLLHDISNDDPPRLDVKAPGPRRSRKCPDNHWLLHLTFLLLARTWWRKAIDSAITKLDRVNHLCNTDVGTEIRPISLFATQSILGRLEIAPRISRRKKRE